MRQEGIVEQIFDPLAFQCTNCGLRYSPNDAMAYKQHKDWHFRMNKNKQTHHKRAHSRRWYLKNSDWIISHEIEDHINELQDDDENEPMEQEVPTVPKSSNPKENTCPVCKEDFVEIYKEENPDLEDDDDGGVYHLQNAIRPGGPGTFAYHPLCFEDASKVGNESLDRFDSMEESYEIEPEVKPEVADKPEVKQETTDKPEVESTDVEMKDEEEKAKVETKTDGDNETEEKTEPTEIEENDSEVKKEPLDETTNDSTINESGDEKKLDETLNLTADAGVSKEFTFPIVSEIKFNVKSQSSAPGSPSLKDEPLDTSTVTEEVKEEESEFDPDAIIQEKSNEDIDDPFRHKPKLKNRKLQELPIAEKGLDYSSLCSIM